MKVKDGAAIEGGKIYLLAEVMEKGLDGSLSKSADRDGAFPFCAAIDSRHEPILRLGHGQVDVGMGWWEIDLSQAWRGIVDYDVLGRRRAMRFRELRRQ